MSLHASPNAPPGTYEVVCPLVPSAEPVAARSFTPAKIWGSSGKWTAIHTPYVASMRTSRRVWPVISPPLPSTFDPRGSGMLGRIRDQGGCGCCWAFATVQCLSDRFRIASKGRMLRASDLSVQCLIDCSASCFENETLKGAAEASGNERMWCNERCGGGSTILAFQHIEETGLPLETDVPWKMANSSAQRGWSCDRSCRSDAVPRYSCEPCYLCSLFSTRYVDADGNPSYAVPCDRALERNELNIMTEIYFRGPVTAAFNIYTDFEDKANRSNPREGYFHPREHIYIAPPHAYPSPNYRGYNEAGLLCKYEGDHILTIVGWGVEGDTKYWIVRNSWGADWGRKGYFYMRRGTNECNIETDVVAAVPRGIY